MRIQLASDLHLEHLDRYFPGERVIRPAPGADVLVLAGDISNGTHAIDIFKDWPAPVIYVAGNHEFYGLCREDVIDELRSKACGTAITFLERDTFDFGGVRILGCTLWTDYLLNSPKSKSRTMSEIDSRLSDHRYIRTRSGALFSPSHALSDHKISRAWLENELAQPYDGKTVVVTHHGPHRLSIHPRYANETINAAFASDLTPMVEKADFWFHGHVHDSFDYPVGRDRVIANPLGYPRNKSSVSAAKDLRFENEHFDFAKVIDITA